MPQGPVRASGQAKRSGTTVQFKPDTKVFEVTEFSFETLASRLRELAFLNAGLKITLRDERKKPLKEAVYQFSGGVSAFVKQLNANKTVLHAIPIVIAKEKDRVQVEAAIQYNEGYGEQVLAFLDAVRKHLKDDGRLLVLQPNFALVGPAYFDFIDHKTILTDKSLVEALEISGFKVEYLKRRFLPYTSKSRIPRAPWMVRLYLAFPPAHFFMGKQTFVVARPKRQASGNGS